MKEQNSIDDFFKKRLDESPVAETAWNVPGDEIWNAAKVHFPKKEKKRYPFLFLSAGLISATLFILAISFYAHKSTTMQSNTSNVIKSSTVNPTIQTSKSILNESRIINTEETSNSKTKLHSSETKDQVDQPRAIQNTSREKHSILSSLHPKVKYNKPDNNELIINNNSDTKKISQPNKTDGSETALNPPYITATYPNIKESTSRSQPLLNDNLETVDAAEFRNNNTTQETIQESISKPTNSRFDSFTEEINSATLFKPLSIHATSPLIYKTDLPSTPSIKEVKIMFQPPPYKWEVGFSHSPFIYNPFNVGNVNLESGEHLHLRSTYRNINFQLTRRVSRRFSFSSGLGWSALDVKLNFNFTDVYSNDNSLEKFNQRVDENTSVGSLTINDASSNIDVDFISGADLVDGDSIQVVGFIPLELRVVQLPFVANYHFRSRKFSWLLHGGLSLDLLHVNLNHLELSAYKSRRLITEPARITPINETAFGLSAYVGGGFKYHIGQHLNIGVSAKIDVTGLIFSRYDIGAYYRF